MTDRTPYRALVHAPGEALDVQPYDFESPELISGEDRDRLDSALEAWGRQLGMLITARTRAVVDVATAPSRVQSFGAYIASAEGPTLWATAQFGSGRALYRVPLAEASYWAARMLGASGDKAAAATTITGVERGLARAAAAEHLADLRPSTSNLLPEPVLQAFGAEPSGSIDRDAQAVVVVVGTIRKGERRQLSLALDVDVVLERLGAVAPQQDAAEVLRASAATSPWPPSRWHCDSPRRVSVPTRCSISPKVISSPSRISRTAPSSSRSTGSRCCTPPSGATVNDSHASSSTRTEIPDDHVLGRCHPDFDR